jgi:hypothetical protein
MAMIVILLSLNETAFICDTYTVCVWRCLCSSVHVHDTVHENHSDSFTTYLLPAYIRVEYVYICVNVDACAHVCVYTFINTFFMFIPYRYESMVEAGEILHGKEFEDAFNDLFPDGLQEIEDEDNHFITEEIEMADFHISTVTQLQKTLV